MPSLGRVRANLRKQKGKKLHPCRTQGNCTIPNSIIYTWHAIPRDTKGHLQIVCAEAAATRHRSSFSNTQRVYRSPDSRDYSTNQGFLLIVDWGKGDWVEAIITRDHLDRRRTPNKHIIARPFCGSSCETMCIRHSDEAHVAACAGIRCIMIIYGLGDCSQ